MDRARWTSPQALVTLAVLVLIGVMPFLAPAVGEPFYVDIFRRIMIWAIAAVGLNLIMGYGGMVSFGHAAYLGIGGYTVGILSYHGIDNGFVQWPLALAVSGLAALVFGAISLRTKGVYFIMITLAFAQMVFFLGVSADRYGSNDGLIIYSRSLFALGPAELDLGNGRVFYYLVFAVLLAILFLTRRLVDSRFGMVLKGTKSNEERTHAVGVPAYRYRLVAFVISGLIVGLAGILMANNEKFVSPDMMAWPLSGELIFMVVLGGMGSLFGPVIGAVTFLLLSEILSNLTEHWHIIFGPFLILVVLYGRGGINGFLETWSARRA
ncbi:MAG: branched-chain amino acid ABC transporter permease [Alphaproteobacteria bacterium]